MATTLIVELGLIGLVMRTVPFGTHPAFPAEAFPVVCIRIPNGQLAGVQADDDNDSSHVDDDSVIPALTGRRTLRALSRLRRAGYLDDWHAFLGLDGNAYVHLRFTQANAERFYSIIDWTLSTLAVTGRRPEHTFAGDG